MAPSRHRPSSELLGLRWGDINTKAGTVTVSGKLVHVVGEGLRWITWRDLNNFGKQWRTAREDLGVPEVTTHSFCKTVTDLIDEEGLSARIGADQLGHSHVSMTQDRYMTRGRVHTEVAGNNTA